ncbi:hypothetical protein [Ruania halotolerans]|uniref:hypothetical protein n=1 Tax=Ruania halotolerans TaxID=2897773 RepID=UPI001E62A108|nr:hypothetical protein [Ruania halotolerans]UFU06551.1 hypothetical protein LQF10_00100 [Ruania halotolerans]
MSQVEFAVSPYRFSADPPAMVAFLETLGMRKVLTTAGDWFGVLRAGAGWVGVHQAASSDIGAAPGETQLVLLTRSAAAAAAELESRGISTTVWDESYGQHAGVTDPTGGGIWINEYQDDLYGYLGHDGEGDPRLSVTMVRPSVDREADRTFFGTFGFVPEAGANEWWEALRASDVSGVIGLHKPMSGEYPTSSAASPFADRTSIARLGFETTEDLDALAVRLSAAGYQARVVVDAVRAVHVTDPDGCRIEIHPART